MRKQFLFLLSFLVLIVSRVSLSQDIQIIVHNDTLYAAIGEEVIFDFDVINISSTQQTIFEVRTINNLPPNWQSSLCFGLNCFAPFLDSVATTSDFQSDPINPGDTLLTSLHVWTLVNEGVSNVQIQVGTFSNPTQRYTLDFTTIVLPTSVDDDNTTVSDYSLEQNYPNPFNPSTTIRFGIKESGLATIKLFDVLGNELAVLVSEHKEIGNHTVNLNSIDLASGIYFYQLSVNDFIQTKKMILEK